MEELFGLLKEMLLNMGPDRVLVVVLILGYFVLGKVIAYVFGLYREVMEKRIEEQLATREVLNELSRVVERVADVVEVKMR